jgi:hypothetical protein
MIRMMKILSACIVLLLSLPSCKKTVQNIQEDLVIKAMTDGQWAVTSFTRNGVDITADFSTYTFKYYSNKTVDARKNGLFEKSGTWDGDAASMTTWANFANPPYPLDLINGSWHITRNSWTYVEATQTGTDNKTMRLEKQ